MQNDRSSSQFSLHSIVIPIYISRKEMITQKKDDSFDVSCNSSLVEGSRRGGMKEKQAVKKREANTLAHHLPSSAWWSFLFYFFQNISFQFQGSSKLDSIFERFFRVVTLRKKKKEKKKGKREQKREENRGGDGRKWGRKAKETARRGGKSRAQWREWKGRRRKGWGSERKIDGGGMYHPAHSIFRVFLFCPPRQPDKGPSGEELAARYSPDQLETRCQMENSSE